MCSRSEADVGKRRKIVAGMACSTVQCGPLGYMVSGRDRMLPQDNLMYISVQHELRADRRVRRCNCRGGCVRSSIGRMPEQRKWTLIVGCLSGAVERLYLHTSQDIWHSLMTAR